MEEKYCSLMVHDCPFHEEHVDYYECKNCEYHGDKKTNASTIVMTTDKNIECRYHEKEA